MLAAVIIASGAFAVAVWAAVRADAAHALACKAVADSGVTWASRPDDPV